MSIINLTQATDLKRGNIRLHLRSALFFAIKLQNSTNKLQKKFYTE